MNENTTKNYKNKQDECKQNLSVNKIVNENKGLSDSCKLSLTFCGFSSSGISIDNSSKSKAAYYHFFW